MPLKSLDTARWIYIQGAHQHNLKHIDVKIPRNQWTVISGLSGSGKSSLAFDTLFAEGQRRYVESLSSYARQFLGRLQKPKLVALHGISPAIAIEQKTISRNPRSTVGTVTELYEYFKLLFARAGIQYHPETGMPVIHYTPERVLTYLCDDVQADMVYILAPLDALNKKNWTDQIKRYQNMGFSKFWSEGQVYDLQKLQLQSYTSASWYLLIDRILMDKRDDDWSSRVLDSISQAFSEGHDTCTLWYTSTDNVQTLKSFSLTPYHNGAPIEKPDLNFFSFNNPIGACKTCEGYGSLLGIDPDLVIPNTSLSVFENAIAPWNGEVMSYYKNALVKNAHKFNFPIHKPIAQLNKSQYQLIWEGNAHFTGLHDFFKMLEQESYKIQYRVMLARYRGKTVCTACRGTRLRADTNDVKISEKSLSDILLWPIDDVLTWCFNLKLDAQQLQISKIILTEIKTRLEYIKNVGLGYLSLNRAAQTLSGGESQRLNLATQLGSALVGSLYILDEPSIGLHARDTEKLIGVLRKLQAQGNTLVVVEHDESIIRAADYLIDMGPEAGAGGGTVVFEGPLKALGPSSPGYTAALLTNPRLPLHTKTLKPKFWIRFKQVTAHNLNALDVNVPLQVMCCITGVSGSGKSSLVNMAIAPRLQRYFEGYYKHSDSGPLVEGDLDCIKAIEYIDQNPIGRSSRSNPATYLKIFDDIRDLMAAEPLSKLRGYSSGYFSFNVPGGRCETCQGEGEVVIDMQFMADVHMCCESCNGTRFKAETLEVTYHSKNITALLNLTVNEAQDFFKSTGTSRLHKRIFEKLKALQDVGMGYVPLGQSSSTLSGGEAQRIKLASFLVMQQHQVPTVFVFDEPSTGLHLKDVQSLIHSFKALLQKGHSVIIIEHHLDIIAAADWIIDLGPEGGAGGGKIVGEGPPQVLAQNKRSYTGLYLKSHLKLQ